MQLNTVVDDTLMREVRQLNPDTNERELVETALRAWLNSRKQRLRRAQQLVQCYVKPARSVVDELIQERREAAEHE